MSEPQTTPYAILGGRDHVVALAMRFYDIMERDELELTALHALDDEGRVDRDSRERFALFLIGWLGGPQEYMATYGHPRLRMRHMHVPIGIRMRDAWVRSMSKAMEEQGVPEPLRTYLTQRFEQVADFMRNVPEPGQPLA
ncbi:MAG: group II truncated hemoglobin [Myxococcota bacterium]